MRPFSRTIRAAKGCRASDGPSTPDPAGDIAQRWRLTLRTTALRQAVRPSASGRDHSFVKRSKSCRCATLAMTPRDCCRARRRPARRGHKRVLPTVRFQAALYHCADAAARGDGFTIPRREFFELGTRQETSVEVARPARTSSRSRGSALRPMHDGLRRSCRPSCASTHPTQSRERATP